MTDIDFHFDFTSPYAYLASTQLPKLAKDAGRAINYLPTDLTAAKLAAGNTGPTTAQIPPKFRYAREDLQRWARYYGVVLKPGPRDAMPPHALDASAAHKGVLFARRQGRAGEFVDRVWARLFGAGAWVGIMDNWIGVVDEMEWSRADFDAFVTSAEAEAEYAAINKAAQERGVFGVPTMFVDNVMWWGNDRLMFMESSLKAMNLT